MYGSRLKKKIFIDYQTLKIVVVIIVIYLFKDLILFENTFSAKSYTN
jgi:hypothetical protein